MALAWALNFQTFPEGARLVFKVVEVVRVVEEEVLGGRRGILRGLEGESWSL